MDFKSFLAGAVVGSAVTVGYGYYKANKAAKEIANATKAQNDNQFGECK